MLNDLWTPLVEYPLAFGFFYAARILWAVFSLLIFIASVRLTTRVWGDFRWWAAWQDGMDIRAKRIVSLGRFRNAVWKSIASALLLLSAVLAVYNMFFGDLPRNPEVAFSNATIVCVLLVFIFSFYMALRANARIDKDLRELEKTILLEQVDPKEAQKKKEGDLGDAESAEL